MIRPHDAFVSGFHASAVAVAVNVVLAMVKIAAGFLGHSSALIADGIESCTDIASTLIALGGLKIAVQPADTNHPYGHGKAEAMAGVLIAVTLLAGAGLIAVQSLHAIATPHQVPAGFTLAVLAVVVAIKECLYRFVFATAETIKSNALQGDAWHHRSDAVTSLAVFAGIAMAMIGGEAYANADDYAALFACAVILYNGARILRMALNELMDASAPEDVMADVKAVASAVAGVLSIEKCRVRKIGLVYMAEIHVVVDGNTTVRDGHAVGHRVKDALCRSRLAIADVLVHIEPNIHNHD